jgi:hypothetical protein
LVRLFWLKLIKNKTEKQKSNSIHIDKHEQQNIIYKINMQQTDYYESNTIQALIVMLELMKSNQVTIYQFTNLVDALKKQNIIDINLTQVKNEINQLINKINSK